jgi:hypothetical protein
VSPSDRFWRRVHRRALRQTPDMARMLARAYAEIQRRLSAAVLEEAIRRGTIGAVLERTLADAALETAFQPVRQQLQETAADAARYFARDIAVPATMRTVAIGFDVLNPKVIDALRTLDTRVMTRLAADVRASLAQHIEAGLRAGVGPRTIARGMRDVVALAPNQERAVANFEAMLRTGDRAALTRALRDHRYDGTLRTLLGEGKPGLSADQIERMTSAYRRRMVAFNAETQARTATLDALKQGQRLAWEDARAKGVIPEGSVLKKSWKGVLDDREREEHVAMEGVTVPFDDPYILPDGLMEMEPGDGEFNCRCLSIIYVAPAGEVPQ